MQDILDRLTTLEVRFEERWTAHDKRADENNAKIDIKLDKIFNKLDSLPCEINSIKIKEFEETRINTIKNYWKLGIVVFVLVCGTIYDRIIAWFGVAK